MSEPGASRERPPVAVGARARLARSVTISKGSRRTLIAEPDPSTGRPPSSSRLVAWRLSIGHVERIDASVGRPDDSYRRTTRPSPGATSGDAIRARGFPDGFKAVTTTEAGWTSNRLVLAGRGAASGPAAPTSSGMVFALPARTLRPRRPTAAPPAIAHSEAS